MSEKSPDKEETPQESENDVQPQLKDPSKENRIVILRERDIPFIEERPPNFSPHFSVTVHRIRKHSEQEEKEE